MDTQKLHEAAREEGGETKFAALLQAELQDGVTSAVTKLATENAEAKATISRMDAKHTEMADEWKPVQKIMKAAEIGWKPDDLPIFEAKLKGGSKPSEDVMEIARSLAGPMAEAGNKDLVTELDEIKAKLDESKQSTAAAILRGDRKEIDNMVQAAQIGEDRPKIIATHLPNYIERHIVPYMHFEDVEIAGKMVRSAVARNGDVPIMTARGQAGVADLIDQAYESKGDEPWAKNTRDFFQSNGTGSGTPPQGGPGELPASQKALGAAGSLDEFEKLRGKSA